MMADFHFLRPFWLLTLLPWVALIGYMFRHRAQAHAWSDVCDSHLLPWLVRSNGRGHRAGPLLMLLSSAVFMIIALGGPTWSRLPVPTYQQNQPRVLVLDMSPDMLIRDLSPDRLSRAKFKLHDLLQHRDAGQFGLVVYTGEPFVVSPLTNDGQTIDALLPTLTPDIMPIGGNRLDAALNQAKQLINEAGSINGQILVLTATPPSQSALTMAKKIAKEGIDTSVIPIMKKRSLTPFFKTLANAGHGHVIPFTDTEADLDQWLASSSTNPQYSLNLENDIPIWRDQGRWFLIPALLMLLPIFRRGWLQRLNS